MMIFNSFTVANDYNFGAQWLNGSSKEGTAYTGFFVDLPYSFD